MVYKLAMYMITCITWCLYGVTSHQNCHMTYSVTWHQHHVTWQKVDVTTLQCFLLCWGINYFVNSSFMLIISCHLRKIHNVCMSMSSVLHIYSDCRNRKVLMLQLCMVYCCSSAGQQAYQLQEAIEGYVMVARAYRDARVGLYTMQMHTISHIYKG